MVSGLFGAVVVLMGLVRHCSSEQIDNFVEEAEGIERKTTALPGRQLELLKASLGPTPSPRDCCGNTFLPS
jgi:hypothetical protein